MKNWTIDEVRELVAQAKQGEDTLYCVALEWADDCGNGDVISIKYFTDKQQADDYAERMEKEGGKEYERFERATIYVQRYKADVKDMTFTVAKDYKDFDDEDFVGTAAGVQLSEVYDEGGVEVDPYVKEVEPETEEKSIEQEERPYNVKGYANSGRQSDYNVDCLTWMWNGRKFEAYGHLRTVEQVRLNLHYSGETGDVHGLGIKWTDPNGKQHDVFCGDCDLTWK